tara:strand:+ start:6811 stop:7014 length:204 start_codon:yes stop_codon:yes gene_type:complete
VKKETKTEEFDSVEALKDRIELAQKKAQRAVQEYQGLVQASFGVFPKSELALVEFVEKVMKMHEVIE